MKKRLRKKYRHDEFRENVFGVRIIMREAPADDPDDEFVWRFLEQAIEAQNLSCGGGGQGSVREFYVQRAGRGSPTEADREAVGHWLSQQPEVEGYSLGDFFDGWHGPEEAPYSAPEVKVAG